MTIGEINSIDDANTVAPLDDVASWAQTAHLDAVEVDCATAVMLKILDGKCKMNEVEKVVMEALYDAVKQRAGLRLGEEIHDLIARARAAPGDALVEQIYELRVLAETGISRPVMKGFKARLRGDGVLPAKV